MRDDGSRDKQPALSEVRQEVAHALLPTAWGEFVIYGFEQTRGGGEHLALVMGDLTTAAPLLARVHSECLTGDALFSRRCDCGAQLAAALQRIGEVGRGALIYLRQEGRGIGLLNKLRAYRLQDEQGIDTVEANEALGFAADARDYAPAGTMLRSLGITRVRLMTNNPRKMEGLRRAGVEIVERLPLLTGRNSYNHAYLSAKAAKFGHLFD
ncbi:MAG: GTP cyclohydrolase II [Nitrococcus sp.]|nr:GTP cyclohydrolase II [Nitrococcus sp.]